jgi:hypothetical protein
MILTHESGSQEDQFDEKKWRQKILWDYPFNQTRAKRSPLEKYLTATKKELLTLSQVIVKKGAADDDDDDDDE